jgi:site-specific recombinase XerD
MVLIIRKSRLPDPAEVIEPLRPAAALAQSVALREPRPAGFPLLFTAELQIIEPAVAFLHEHFVQRAHTVDTLRTYSEILFDWFETLEQNGIAWNEADAADLVAYRNRMVTQPSGHTNRPYQVTTINHRVRGVLRFYQWAVRNRWLVASPLAGKSPDYVMGSQRGPPSVRRTRAADDSLFALRQFESLPRPLTSVQARELLATLVPPYDLMARWQIYTGLRVSELLRIGVSEVTGQRMSSNSHQTIDVIRKGRKSGYVIAPASLLEETAVYLSSYRHAWLQRARRHGRAPADAALFINSRGAPVCKNTYQQVINRAGQNCGFKATTHLLRATFACMLLARLEQIASQGTPVNPLLVVKVLMGHEHIATTDRYLRAIAVDACVLKDVLEALLSGARQP